MRREKQKSRAVPAAPRKIKTLVPRLLAWFAANARDLPWRRTRDPYAIWVSEVMLQQTQVKTVTPYWERWMRELPTLRALAAASPARLHKLWEGLGYYTRVRNLQKAARQIVAGRNGAFPESFADVLALPGVGRYTAGAVCSIAFNQPTPVLDGNVIRVLTRLFGIADDPRSQPANDHLWRLAEQLVQHAARLESPAGRRAKDFPVVPSTLAARPWLAGGCCSHLNQSLMELGAVLCAPRRPDCPGCPLARHCVACREGCVEEVPRFSRAAPATNRRFVAFVIQAGNRYLVRQRPAGVVNAQLWEFPNLELQGEPPALAELAATAVGDRPRSLRHWHQITHSITRYRITLDAYRGQRKADPHQTPAGCHWVTRAAMERLAFTSAHAKLRQRLERPKD